MAANAISQLTTANTFQHWLIATQSLIGTANTLTNGNGNTFFANTRLEVGGVNASLNVQNSASINVLYSNTITAYGTTLNISSSNTTISGDLLVSGNLVVSGNITLDAIGFDDLIVSGSGTFANTLSVTGNSTFSTANVVSLVGTANTAIYTAIANAEEKALAFSIALG
jgi:hypothetical protein